MGAGHSGHFHGTKGGRCSNIENNAREMLSKYPITQHGYFGQAGHNSSVRVIYSNNPIATAKDFFRLISKGARTDCDEGKTVIRKFADGSVIVYRESSKSGSPAVDINIWSKNIKKQKIHFEVKNK